MPSKNRWGTVVFIAIVSEMSFNSFIGGKCRWGKWCRTNIEVVTNAPHLSTQKTRSFSHGNSNNNSNNHSISSSLFLNVYLGKFVLSPSRCPICVCTYCSFPVSLSLSLWISSFSFKIWAKAGLFLSYFRPIPDAPTNTVLTFSTINRKRPGIEPGPAEW